MTQFANIFLALDTSFWFSTETPLANLSGVCKRLSFQQCINFFRSSFIQIFSRIVHNPEFLVKMYDEGVVQARPLMIANHFFGKCGKISRFSEYSVWWWGQLVVWLLRRRHGKASQKRIWYRNQDRSLFIIFRWFKRNNISCQLHRCAWDFPPEGGYFPAQHVAGLLQLCRGGKCWAMK